MFLAPPFPPILRPILLRAKWWRFDANRSRLILSRTPVRSPTPSPDPNERTQLIAGLRATDEIIERHTLRDATWTDLTAHFTTQQVLDLIFLLGQYQLVAGALNALRVERDGGLDAKDVPFPMPAE
jgi:alkylhydroperoxidase family enzyme